MIINIEWGNFNDGLPITVYDKEIDEKSVNPGNQVEQFYSDIGL